MITGTTYLGSPQKNRRCAWLYTSRQPRLSGDIAEPWRRPKWMPEEELYLAAEDPVSRVDLVLDSTS